MAEPGGERVKKRVTRRLGWYSELEGLLEALWSRWLLAQEGKPGQRESIRARSPSQWAGRTGLKTRFLTTTINSGLESSDYGHSLLHLTTAVRMRIPRQV